MVRVGKYSMECQTREAVDILHRQFQKFVTPSVPQQEERIQEVVSLAQRLYGEKAGFQRLSTKHSITRYRKTRENTRTKAGQANPVEGIETQGQAKES